MLTFNFASLFSQANKLATTRQAVVVSVVVVVIIVDDDIVIGVVEVTKTFKSKYRVIFVSLKFLLFGAEKHALKELSRLYVLTQTSTNSVITKSRI